jgi:hypothetical protein
MSPKWNDEEENPEIHSYHSIASTHDAHPSSEFDGCLIVSVGAAHDAIRAAGMSATWAEESAVGMAGAVVHYTAHFTAVALPGASLALEVFRSLRRLLW